MRKEIWTLQEHERHAMDEIAASSDRAAAIVLTAIIDDRVDAVIRKHLHQDKKVLEKLFHSSGPIGAFSAKIDLGYLLGIYGDDSLKDLHTIRKIRNEFAHNLAIQKFTESKIRDLTKNLTFPDRFTVRAETPDGQEVALIALPKNHGPRRRFTVTCQMFIMRFDFYMLNEPAIAQPAF